MYTQFQDYWEALKPKLDQAFGERLALFFGEDTLNDPLSLRATLEGGKKIRGGLLCLACHSLGGDLESAIPRAVALELIQTATLIHDDFVDQDTARRNMPAAWTLEGARRAVLLGDVIFATAIEMMSDLSREDGQVISHAIAQVSEGAFLEPTDLGLLKRKIESNKLNGTLYEKIIRLKTGILFGAACRLGAIGARAPGEVREKFLRYGSRIGEAYQIADDMKEIKHHLSTGFIDPGEMALLTPVFFYFVDEIGPHIPAVLDGKHKDVNGPLKEYFLEAVRLMEKEIAGRLQSAVSEIEKGIPDSAYSELIRRAPRDLIGMFNTT